MSQHLQYWEVWYPEAAATGVLLARGLVDPTERVLFHSAPDAVTVEVRDQDGRRIAFGRDLPRTQSSPMCRLRLVGDTIEREDIWPTDGDTGSTVLLPGGEAGILRGWWNAEDRKEWRWQVEFYNSIR